MRFCLNTDCLGYMPFEEMLDTVAALGYESIEIACGNWSKAPHIDLDAMLASEETRKNYMDAIAKRGLVLEVLNCSGNQLAPNEEGKQHQEVVEKTFKLAGLLDRYDVRLPGRLGRGSHAELDRYQLAADHDSHSELAVGRGTDSVLEKDGRAGKGKRH